MAKTCTHEDTRLTCVECSKPVCSNCMVQCPVGFRCKSCIGSATKPQTTSERLLLARTFAICVVTGFAAAWLMPFIGFPYLTCIIWFFIGTFVGGLLAKVIDYNIGRQATIFIVFGLLFGMSWTPMGQVFPVVCMDVGPALISGGDFFGALLNVVSFMFTPIGFILGVLRSAV